MATKLAPPPPPKPEVSGKPKSHRAPRPSVPPPAVKGGRVKAKEELAPMKFVMDDWNADDEGEKIILYAPPGKGKSTLAMMAPKPVFIGLDDGARKLRHPVTGERPKVVSNPETGRVLSTWMEVRNVLAQPDLFDPFESIVLDTGTRLEELCTEWVLANIKGDSGWVQELEGYGYGKGYRHVFDNMMHPLVDFDELVRRGKNIIIICHQVLANQDGGEYRKHAPELITRNNANICNKWMGWCDHVFKIDHAALSIDKKKKKAVDVGNGYAVYVHGDPSFEAKSRTIDIEDRVISFSDPTDNSIWIELFGEDYDA